MPKLGFDMAEGKLGEWTKAEGEAVTQGETIVLVETDKATVEVPVFRSGVLLKVLVPAGESVPIGTPIAVIGEAGEQADLAALGVLAPAAAAPTSAAPVAAPAAAPAPAAHARVPESASASPFIQAQVEHAPPEGGRLLASPVAVRMAGELGIDLARVKGTGPDGRIIKRDIEAHLKEREVTPPAPAARRAAAAQAFGPAEEGDVVEPLSPIRQTIGRRMTESKTTTPHFYVTMEVDMEAALETRAQLNALVPETDKISVSDLVTKAAAVALRQFPKLNASFAGDAINVHQQINIGIAVARETGLITVVVRDVDEKTLPQVARETRDVVSRSREGKMKPDDMMGATFTISNLGMFDVDDFIAIINPPQAAILAVGAVKKTPVVNAAGEVVPGTRMKVTLSADHRVTDGAEVARFLQALKAALEQPMRLMI
jgi:pyruvate dehydrogenase E2 component (dihydrolipoamide acetyltransferase)